MKNSNPVPAQYRQGDVMVVEAGKLASGLKKIERDAGRIVLANGKGNGRAHVLVDPKAEMLADKEGTRFLQVVGKKIKGTFAIVRHGNPYVTVCHDGEDALRFRMTDVTIGRKNNCPVAKVDGFFGLVRHDCAQPDHATLALPRGNYRIVRQREFQQGDVRNVID